MPEFLQDDCINIFFQDPYIFHRWYLFLKKCINLLLNFKMLLTIILILLWTPIELFLLKARLPIIDQMGLEGIHIFDNIMEGFLAKIDSIIFINSKPPKKETLHSLKLYIIDILLVISMEHQINFHITQVMVQEEIFMWRIQKEEIVHHFDGEIKQIINLNQHSVIMILSQKYEYIY